MTRPSYRLGNDDVPDSSGGATRPGEGPRRWRPGPEGLAWAFVAFGVLLRLVRFALRYPIWGDEAFVAVNLLTRDYLGLLRPLDHGMACPLLFLWVERALVDWLGFNELSLRLFPTACGVASVVVFRLMAGRVLRGLPMLLAVAIFSVAFYPIRHGGEVKPYASDLLVALLLWAPAIEWWRSRDDRWIWALAAIVPMALGLSHPAVFVAGGISLGLAAPVWRSGRRGARTAHLAFDAILISAFAVLYLAFTGPHSAAIAREAPNMHVYWSTGFPPRNSFRGLVGWLIREHTGHMFAYPGGGDRGVSSLTSFLFATAVIDLARRRRATLLALLLAPFGLTFLAASARCYPYGGSTRTMLFLAPAVCLLAGHGAAGLVARLRPARRRWRIAGAWVAALAGFGLVSLGLDLAHPYKSVDDQRARAFARRFWAEQGRYAELVCLRNGLGIAFRPVRWKLIRTPIYLCNQAIYAGRPRGASGPRLEAISESRPLRCVLFDERPLGKAAPEDWAESAWREPALVDWLARMRTRYTLRDVKTYVVNEGACRDGVWSEDRYVVLEFVPAPCQRAEARVLAEGPCRGSIRR